MPTISVDYDSSKDEITLRGDIETLKQHRFAWNYVKSRYNPIIEENQLRIHVDSSLALEAITRISEDLPKYGFSHEKSESSEQVLLDFYEEEKRFAEFSKRALAIRNNECSVEEFSAFTESLAQNMTARTLYPLQLLASYHLAFSQNACNFSVPGAGKTSIVYGAYAYLSNLKEYEAKKVDRLLIIGPLSSFGPWETEYLECFGEAPSSKRLVSNIKREDKISYLYSSCLAKITLISYSSLISVLEDVKFFLRHNKVMVVLDEAHKAKNTAGGVIAKAVIEIASLCKSRVVLTGTPAPNGYEDLFNLLKFIWPSKRIIGYSINQLTDMSERPNDTRVKNLIDSISPYFIRIRKSDLGIPPATEHPAKLVEMGPFQKRIYDFIESKYLESFQGEEAYTDSSSIHSLVLKAKVIRLMQAATNPEMLQKPIIEFFEEGSAPVEAYKAFNDSRIMNEILEYRTKETPIKYSMCKDMVEEVLSRGGKVVIWATFIHTILNLKEYLGKNGIKAQELYGAIPVNKEGMYEENEESAFTREQIIRRFERDDCPYKVIIANPFAVSESISLHRACHNAIYIERSFNAAHYVQSKDRIHRYGLDPSTSTNYYRILSSGSIDETIDRRLIEKEQRMIEIMESMPIPLFNTVSSEMGNEDIRELMRDYARRNRRV